MLTKRKVNLDKHASDKLLRHVVLFAFKETATSAQIQKIVRAFADLPHKIKEIHHFEWGADVSVENLAQSYTHCFLVTFLSEADRDAYLPHPSHKEFVNLLEPHLDRALVFDYWTA